MVGVVLVHIETVPIPQGERYGPDFKAMNKLAAIKWVARSFYSPLNLPLIGD